MPREHSKPPVLALRGVVKRFGHVRALDRMELSVERGEAVALVGPSGCGKTTALKALNGLVQPDSGSVEVDGTPLAATDLIAHRRSTGYVIQEVGLLPHWTIERNIATVLLLQGERLASVRSRIDDLLDAVQLDRTLKQRRPWELSGGQRQRAGIARALAARPRCVLMDEPFGALDPLTRLHLRRLMQQLRQRSQLSLVLVTHDLQDARVLADRVCVMNRGRLVEQLSSDALDRARDPWVRQFLAPAAREADDA